MTYKTAEQIELMRQAGKAVAAALEAMRKAVQPGISTLELDEIAAETLKKHGAVSTLKGYQPPFSSVPYLHTICASINNEVVHGVPNAKRILQEGDIISLDLDASVDGWVADAAITVPVGKISPVAANLITITKDCLYKAISQAKPGKSMGDVSSAIQKHAEKNRCQAVRECQGHGIGRTPHEKPDVPCIGRPGFGIKLRTGMTFCIEPMINLGDWRIADAPGDPWTLVTRDGSLSAHFEHTIAVTEKGPDILTLPEETA
jgi:methionyl aminopeptidase